MEKYALVEKATGRVIQPGEVITLNSNYDGKGVDCRGIYERVHIEENPEHPYYIATLENWHCLESEDFMEKNEIKEYELTYVVCMFDPYTVIQIGESNEESN